MVLANIKIGVNGVILIAEALKDNSTLKSLNLAVNAMGMEGTAAIANALIVNSTLTSTLTTLALVWNGIQINGATAIAAALRFNPSITSIEIDKEFEELFDELLKNAVNTQHDLKHLLEMVIGEDGAQVLSIEFCMKFPVIKGEIGCESLDR
jgi:Leucine Rich repeat